jgi:dsDNA-specific endonuclease/ATPase MutS2
MEETEKLSFADVKKRIGEHLKTALDIEKFSMTFAKQENDLWKVNVEFTEKGPAGLVEWPTTALFSIDATTGEVKQFKKGYLWRF